MFNVYQIFLNMYTKNLQRVFEKKKQKKIQKYQ